MGQIGIKDAPAASKGRFTECPGEAAGSDLSECTCRDEFGEPLEVVLDGRIPFRVTDDRGKLHPLESVYNTDHGSVHDLIGKLQTDISATVIQCHDESLLELIEQLRR